MVFSAEPSDQLQSPADVINSWEEQSRPLNLLQLPTHPILVVLLLLLLLYLSGAWNSNWLLDQVKEALAISQYLFLFLI